MNSRLTELFDGVYSFNSVILTKNLVPGKKVYSEELFHFNKEEFRSWNPNKSKLCAGIKKGLKNFPFRNGSNVLYLGSSEGTTVSHLSDVIGLQGKLIGIDISTRAMHKFLFLCEQRPNIFPVLGDANTPGEYRNKLEGIKFNVLFQDVSQPNQAEIFNKNAEMYLSKNSLGLIAIKAHSIDSSRKPKEVIEAEINELEKKFEILETINLEPFEKHHALIVGRKK
ncbi:MAG: fibrillarin-like rRNA/tRNA 2'-O-methyltransferase [Candidatus Diapherotrites archaeon]|nr:fibrillarin-like rRNA/tRNA 2'-O-methyltransferase [Candidatus Diapherotrites archaeon]